jgi:hypothetical protein
MARTTIKPTGWNRPLAYPLKLREGNTIDTMAQAAHLMTQLPPGAAGKADLGSMPPSS